MFDCTAQRAPVSSILQNGPGENRAGKNLLYQQEHYDSAERKGDVREPCGMRRDMPGAKAGKPLL
ncbi:hypothetical protein WCP94_000529 (plasmid) [Bilophila wadsworthia]